MLRIVVGSALTILSVTLVAVVLQWVTSIGNDLQNATTLASAVIAPMVTGAALVIWGIPIHILLSKLGKESVGWYMLAGFVPAPILIFSLNPFGHDPLISMALQSVYIGTISATGATFFWLYVVKPEKIQ